VAEGVQGHVGVAGAGIGGPVLAQALRARGVEGTVSERDRAPGDTAGYRLHPDPAAPAALRRALPAGRLTALLAGGGPAHPAAAGGAGGRPGSGPGRGPGRRAGGAARAAPEAAAGLATAARARHGPALPAVDRGPAPGAVPRGARVPYPAAP
jgi:hypothetical protein